MSHEIYIDLDILNQAWLGQNKLVGPDVRDLQKASLNALRKLGAPLDTVVTFRSQGARLRSCRLDFAIRPPRSPGRRMSASSMLGRAAPTMRKLDPILANLRLQAVAIEPLDPHRLPGKRSCKARRHFWRADDCKPVHLSHRVRAA